MNSFDKIVRFSLRVSFIVFVFTLSSFGQTSLIVEQNKAQVNELSDYNLSFQTNIGDYAHINKGQLVITLPSGFSTETLDSVEIIDDFKHIQYTIKKIENDVLSTRLFLNRDRSYDDDDDDDDGNGLSNIYPSDTTVLINVTIKLSKIHNPSKSGDYQLSLLGLRDNKKIAIGPLLSDPFRINPSSVYTITVTPSGIMNLKAGDVQQFSASAFDAFGNKIEGAVFEWSLFECSNCIGQFVDSTLHVTRIGEGIAQATAGGVSGFSETITVTPGDLSRMTLQIDETQFVGNVINHNAAVILYDAFNNLKTDYDLSANPIELVLSSGELNKYVLDDNMYQVGGVVRLKEFELIYSGLSGQVDIYAFNGFVSSNVELVHFNNYDIIDVQNVNGETISSVFAGQPVKLNILLQNNGNLKFDNLQITYRWKSDSSRLHPLPISPVNPGELIELSVLLPSLNSVGAIDELIVSTYSEYLRDSLTITSVRNFTVEVLDVAQLSIVPESFKPDTIIHQIPFDISFDVQVGGFAQTIDSTKLSIVVVDKLTQQAIAELYNGRPEHLSFIDGVISYGSISAMLNSNVLQDNGWYDVVMDYQLFSSGNMLTLSEPLVDSMFIFFDNGITLVEGSLTPKIVYAGTNVSFEFELNLESDVAYEFHGNLSSFRLFDNSFSSSTNLFLDTDSLYPGLNKLRSAAISIQPEQVGIDLFSEADFVFCLPGVADSLKYHVSFNEPIAVFELPLVQIVDLEVVAPNAPIVNSSQAVQFKASVVNLSSSSIDSVLLELKTIDGYSTIVNSIIASEAVQSSDTAIVYFDVIAASSEMSLPESFRVDLAGSTIGMIAPVNNSAFLIIEEPARLELNYRINGIENVFGFVVKQSEQIHLQLDMDNVGTAEVNHGTYQLVISGLNDNRPDTLVGDLFADSTIDLSFVAPAFDTVLNFEFVILEKPIDINIGSEALLDIDMLDFSVLTISNAAEVIVEPKILGSNLVLPGRSKEIIELTFTNNSSSSLNSIEIKTIDLSLFSTSHNSLDVSDVLVVGNTFFKENEEKISTTTAGGSMLLFWFTDFVIAAQETRVIQLVVEFKESNNKELLLEILEEEIKAVYIDGPNIGQDVIIKSTANDHHVLSYHVVLKGTSLEDSFIIENNPINPQLQPVQFTYELTEEASIEFQMFTLTGEEVFRAYYQAGSFGASVGENIIAWDGRNNSGEMVLNGVYIASILNKATGDYARIKVAVVK